MKDNTNNTNTKKQKSEKDKNGKLSTYVVVMLLSIIIVIIIAAMADSREQNFQNQIDSTTQANMTIQTEIVSLKDENYTLSQDKKDLQNKVKDLEADNNIFIKLNEVCKLLSEENADEAATKYSEIDADTIPEACAALYAEIGKLLPADEE